MGTAQGIYPWVGTLVMGNLMGRRFWVGRECFFLGGRGGKRKHQGTVSRVGRWTTRAFKQPHFLIYYMLSSGGYGAACLQVIMKGVLDPRLPWSEPVLFLPSGTSRPSPHIEDGEGDTAPRSATDSTEQWV